MKEILINAMVSALTSFYTRLLRDTGADSPSLKKPVSNACLWRQHDVSWSCDAKLTLSSRVHETSSAPYVRRILRIRHAVRH